MRCGSPRRRMLGVWSAQAAVCVCRTSRRAWEFGDACGKGDGQVSQKSRCHTHAPVQVEASLQWYNSTKANPWLYAADYQVLFVETVRAAAAQVRALAKL